MVPLVVAEREVIGKQSGKWEHIPLSGIYQKPVDELAQQLSIGAP